MAQSLTGSISWDGGSVSLVVMSKTNCVSCLYFLPFAPEQQIFRHKIPGVKGSIVVLGKPSSQQLHVGVRYIASGTVSSVISTSQIDIDSMANALDITVEVCDVEWKRCHLKSAIPLKPARPLNESLVYMDYELVFDCDNGGYE